MMKFKDYKCQVFKDFWVLVPTVALNFNSPVYYGRNLAVEIHFLCVHMRWFWLEER